MSSPFFSGDFTSKPRVNLRGKSKEQDRKRLLEQARLDRERRQQERLEKRSASVLQAFVRRCLETNRHRNEFRSDWRIHFGSNGELADKKALQIGSTFLPQLLFFFQESNADDVRSLATACTLVLQALSTAGPAGAFSTVEIFVDNRAIIDHRVKVLALHALCALHYHRFEWTVALARAPESACDASEHTPRVLLETILALTASGPHAIAVMTYLAQQGLFPRLRDLLLALGSGREGSSMLERGALLVFKQHLSGGEDSSGRLLQPGWREAALPHQLRATSQLLTIPFFWQEYPLFKKAVAAEGLWHAVVESLQGPLPQLFTALPPSLSPSLPSGATLLGNLLEPASAALAQQTTSTGQAAGFALVVEQLLQELPPGAFPQAETHLTDDMEVDGQPSTSNIVEVDLALREQLSLVAASALTTRMVHLILPPPNEHPSTSSPPPVKSSEALPVGALCAFLHATNVLLPSPQRTRLLTGLAFQAQLVPRLWQYIRQCHLAQSWPPMELPGREGPGAETLGWMLPLAVFCPVYSYLLATSDDEEFYVQQKPLHLADLAMLINILKEAAWQFLWMSNRGGTGEGLVVDRPSRLFASTAPKSPPPASTPATGPLAPPTLQKYASNGASRLLAQLNDWNSHRQYTPPETFHAKDVVDDSFVNQAVDETSKARELLLKAPFLVPFTDRVRVYQALLSRAKDEAQPIRGAWQRGARVTIRRDHIVEDGFDHLNSLGPTLKGTVRIQFINEFGAEEAGVDGGGLFKDFMESITRVAFDVQYGLFKETADHLLYPNPSSHLVSDEHLRYFEFLGRMLAKAMYENILVDIPFAPFFLSKLQQKSNHLNDLPSLDPELYRSLIFLKHYDGDVSDLGLYFVIENDELGEVQETELVPGGKDTPVTNDNRIRYIHLVANHRLNVQIRKQSQAFLQGFTDLIEPSWIAFFSEREMQLLISGSREGLDIEDLKHNVTYSGGYKEDHPAVVNFWAAVRTFTKDEQSKLLKFVTGTTRGPLLGFRYLEPKFCIYRASPDVPTDELLDRLPTSATCMNLLKLPPYRSKEAMREKLLYAITSGAGFDLS